MKGLGRPGGGPRKRYLWVLQRIPKAELANFPRIFFEYSGKLGASPPISEFFFGIFFYKALKGPENAL